MTQVFIGFANTQDTGSAFGGDFFILYGDAGVTAHLSLRWNAAGVLGLYRGGTLIATASVTVREPVGVWHYIEMSATIADSGGTCVVKINGTEVINFTGDTKNAGTATTIDAIRFQRTVPGNVYWDDYYLCDATGSAPYNTFLGEVRVQALMPTGAGASTQWTPSTGANWAAVDEVPPSATDYVLTATSGFRDTYAMSDLTGTVNTVLAARTYALAKKSDTGAASIKIVDRSGSTDYYSTSAALATTDTTMLGTLRITDPATSAAWTASGVNALQAGVELA
jgi:hypothetical protein